MVLERALNIKKDFYIHTLRTLDLLAADPSTANGETESSTAGLHISADHLHCQVCPTENINVPIHHVKICTVIKSGQCSYLSDRCITI